MFDRMLSLVVALSLALLVWLYARSRDQEVLDNVPVPVQVTLAPDQAEHYRLELTGSTHVMVSFTGSPLRIRELQGMLQHNELQIPLTFTVPAEHLNESRYIDSILVESTDLHTPPGVTAVMVEGRNHISLTLHRLIERRLPVRFDSVSEEAIGPVVIEPATVVVRGPQDVLERARAISTQPSELPTRSALTGAAARVPLVLELEGRPVEVTPNRVTVRMPAEARKIYELPEVPVHFLCPVDFPLRPKFFGERAGRIRLRVQGPVCEELPKVYAFVDLIQGHCASAGRYHEPIQLQLPKDFELAQDPPRGVSFQLVPSDGVSRGLDATIPAP
ncbi:MAG TPA: YbbR-like domain-containing protein [Gemmataceae bacterium]|nr:YbbR-like domain-containing protein [Gemmataceae bacterium]